MAKTNGPPDGIWVLYEPPEGAKGLHVRFTRDESGRWVISDLYLHGGALTADMLRGISLSRMEAMEAWMNHPTAPSVIRPASTRRPGIADDPKLTVAELRRRAEAHHDHGELPASYFQEMSRNAESFRSPEIAKLERPDGSDPEQFYRQVALAYRQYAAESKAPARAIADQADVPVTTVHRWIREARRRGFLPPGRKGRVG